MFTCLADGGGGGRITPRGSFASFKEGNYTNSATMQLQRICFQNAASVTELYVPPKPLPFLLPLSLNRIGRTAEISVNAKTKNDCLSYLTYYIIDEKRTVAFFRSQIPHSSWAISLADVIIQDKFIKGTIKARLSRFVKRKGVCARGIAIECWYQS